MARELLAGRPFRADPHGSHLWLPLPDSWSENAFAAAARRAGVLVQPSSAFAAGSRPPDAVRLCLSHEPGDERVARGLAIVADLIGRPGGDEELIL